MILIFGGAYQGKVDFAKASLGLDDSRIFACTDDMNPELDLASPAVSEAQALCNFEKLILALTKKGLSETDFLKEHLPELQGKIIILDDISQGVVPMDPLMRAWREAAGRAMLFLGGEASQVYRVFCGIGNRIK